MDPFEGLDADLTTTERLLAGIGSELHALNLRLDRVIAMMDTTDESDPDDVWDCQRCPATLNSSDMAEAHARDEHGAPRSAWREVYA